MRTFTKMAAQGDFLIIRIDNIPSNVVPFSPEKDNTYVVAHSETGHNHVMVADRVQGFKSPVTNDAELYQLFFSVEAPTEINHLRSYDTHDTLLVPPGNYMVRRQREYVAEGFRRAQD
jgi:hypothetical protein